MSGIDATVLCLGMLSGCSFEPVSLGSRPPGEVGRGDGGDLSPGETGPGDAVTSGDGASGAEGDVRTAGDLRTAGDVRIAGDAPTGGKTVFVTAGEYAADFGGLPGADDLCRSEASVAGLAGVYLAWLADDSGSPATRFVRGGAPYRLVTGTVVAGDWQDLTDGSLQSAISLTASGDIPTGGKLVWTGVAVDGTAVDATRDCDAWTTSAAGAMGWRGQYNMLGSTWTNLGQSSCSGFAFHLYCFEQ